MLTNKIITINKYYYDKNNCRFVLCESCWWFATILKDVSKVIQCPRCKKKKRLYIERILGISKNNNNNNLSNFV
jgi:hypothetical protein